MTTGLKMFLLAAQELNFSRAASLAYVTPQCLSDHIRRLEEQYGVKLFTRRPNLQLTAEGETMLRYLSRIRALEDGMKNELADVSGGVRGTLRLGMPATRGNILLPRIVTAFRCDFPNVDVEIRLHDTRSLETLLLEGELDLFLGVDTAQHALFKSEELCRERLYLVISSAAMKERFGGRCGAMREEFRRSGASLAALESVPFVQGHSGSTTTLAVEQLMLEQNAALAFPVRVSSFDLLLSLCRTEHCATVCSRSHLRRVMEARDGALEVFALRGGRQLTVELVGHRDAQPLAYRTAFAAVLGRCVREEDWMIRVWLEENGITEP